MTAKEKQMILALLGFDPGYIDGIEGYQTNAALKAFKRSYSHLYSKGVTDEVALLKALHDWEPNATVKEDTSSGDANNYCEWTVSADGYFHIPKGKRVRLSKDFYSTEYDCQGQGCCTETVIHPGLVAIDQRIRDHFGTAVTITSGYRCARHNAAVSRATASNHIKGDASDIVVSGRVPRDVAIFAEDDGILGVGLYETSLDGHFVHVDRRSYKSFWYGQACSPVTTFK